MKTKLRQWANQAIARKPYPNPPGLSFYPSRYYRFLEILANNTAPKLSVELGVHTGGGSMHLCIGWPRGQVVGIDIVNEFPENIQYVKDKYPNFEFRIGDSVELAQSVRMQYGTVDILFIDTSHTYEQAKLEYKTWKPFMSSNGIMCFDDPRIPGVGRFWDELPEPKLRLDDLHIGAPNGGGFGVIWNE